MLWLKQPSRAVCCGTMQLFHSSSILSHSFAPKRWAGCGFGDVSRSVLGSVLQGRLDTSRHVGLLLCVIASLELCLRLGRSTVSSVLFLGSFIRLLLIGVALIVTLGYYSRLGFEFHILRVRPIPRYRGCSRCDSVGPRLTASPESGNSYH